MPRFERRSASATLYDHSRVRMIQPVNASFRMHLQGVLAQYCARNPRYSLRAFARRLGMNHSTLSQLLRGKRPFSASTIKAIGKRLGLTNPAIEAFITHERQFPSNHSAREIELQHRILE